MRNFCTLIFSLITLTTTAQNDKTLIGKMEIEKLKNSEHSEWFMNYYNSYEPQDEKLEQLQNALPKGDFKFEIFYGSWCPDSQREIPRMVKIFEKIGIQKDKYDLIGVNRFKDLPEAYANRSGEIKLNRVPTLIYYKNGNEINRYVEFAQVSLLDDLLLIVQEKGYKHSYFSN